MTNAQYLFSNQESAMHVWVSLMCQGFILNSAFEFHSLTGCPSVQELSAKTVRISLPVVFIDVTL